MKRSFIIILVCLVILKPCSVFAESPGYGNTNHNIFMQPANRFRLAEFLPLTGYAPSAHSSYSMTEFLASYTKKAVVLNWTTTFDINKDHFEVERSTDGIRFKHAGTVKAQGSLTTPHLYTYSDVPGRKFTATKDLYYRLKQVDLNGNTMYSKVLVVRVYKTKALQMVSATPNPVLNDIQLNVQLNENAYMVMKVVNASGTEILRKSARGNSGQNNVILEGTSRLHPGIYYLEVIINSHERMMIKLVKE